MSDFDKIPMLEPYSVVEVASALSETEDYNHSMLNIPAMWARTRGNGVRVAVLDTGAPSHVDIKVHGYANFTDDTTAADSNGHGTHVAGIIAATAGNGIGVRGIAPEARLYCGKVLGRDGAGSIDSISRGIRWAVDCVHADVVNMSLGCLAGQPVPRMLEEACEYARSKGVVIVAAAGNDAGAVNYPACFSTTIAVAAVDKNAESAKFSCRGPSVDFSAGGVDVFSTWLGNAYARLSGTSMACPVITGVAALVIADEVAKTGAKPSVDEVYERLRAISVDIGAPGRDDMTGHGMPVFGHDAPAGAKSGVTRSFFMRLVLKILNFFGISR